MILFRTKVRYVFFMNPFLSSVDEMSFNFDSAIEMEWGNLNTHTYRIIPRKKLNCACAFPQKTH